MKIGYVFTEVPSIAGAFPNAELDEMASRGVAIEIFILRGRPALNAEARRIEERFVVHRSPYLLSRAVILDVLRAFVAHPLLFLRLVARTFVDAATSPMILVKSLGVVPKSVHMAVVAQKRGITLIHAYWASLPALGASIMSALSGIPFTMWAHAGADIYNRRHQTPRALRSRLREARKVFTCNRANLDYFKTLATGVRSESIVLLTHGVDLDRFSRANRRGSLDYPLILAVGRPSRTKGFDVLVRACLHLHEEGLRFQCKIAGPGSVDDIGESATAVPLATRGVLEFLGPVDHQDLARLYSEAEIFVIPSVIGPWGSRDGLPNALLEAMASGVACVGSDVASIPEVIEDGETGLLVPPGDAKALSHALARLLRDPDLRTRLADSAAFLVRQSYGRNAAMERLHMEFLALHAGTGGGRESRARPSLSPADSAQDREKSSGAMGGERKQGIP